MRGEKPTDTPRLREGAQSLRLTPVIAPDDLLEARGSALLLGDYSGRFCLKPTRVIPEFLRALLGETCLVSVHVSVPAANPPIKLRLWNPHVSTNTHGAKVAVADSAPICPRVQPR
jgi:hypothetical protein